MKNEELLNKIIHLMQTDESADAPEEAVRWSKNLFRSRAAEPKKSLVEKIFAVLQMDLSPDRAAFGERSASSSPGRQMLFSAGDNQIDLRLTPAGKGFKVAGQILGEGFSGAEVKIFNDRQNFTAKTNDLSEFSFEKISKGFYTLSLSSKNKEIFIENIKIS